VSRALLAFLAAVSTAVVAAVACQGLPPIQPCGEIPGEGCPAASGGTCADLTCSALYDCEEGSWVLLQTCPVPEGGAGGGGTGGAGGGGTGADAGPCVPVTLDAGPLGADCMPDLAFPDCDFDAITCADTACFTGCSDFFICSGSTQLCMGGAPPCWVDVAYCDDYGQFHLTGP
jgi:hypothetical protein